MSDRAARLAALRAAAAAEGQHEEQQQQQQQQQQQGGGRDEAAQQKPVLRFRNYAPAAEEQIAHEKVAPAQVPEFEEVQVDVDAALGEDPEEVLVSVAPKKANWDLRRDIAGKLAKLERRTQAAMIKLMQQEEDRRQQEEQAGA